MDHNLSFEGTVIGHQDFECLMSVMLRDPRHLRESYLQNRSLLVSLFNQKLHTCYFPGKTCHLNS